MKANRTKAAVISIVALFLVLSSLSFVSAEEYHAMKGVDSANVIFDMRDGIPKSAAVHMKLIHDTYKELAAMKKKPDFVVVFMARRRLPTLSLRCARLAFVLKYVFLP